MIAKSIVFLSGAKTAQGRIMMSEKRRKSVGINVGINVGLNVAKTSGKNPVAGRNGKFDKQEKSAPDHDRVPMYHNRVKTYHDNLSSSNLRESTLEKGAHTDAPLQTGQKRLSPTKKNGHPGCRCGVYPRLTEICTKKTLQKINPTAKTRFHRMINSNPKSNRKTTPYPAEARHV